MKPAHFIAQLDEQRIVAAIAEAERKTSGEIRVYISHKARHDVMSAAQQRFIKLNMAKTRHRNGVLIYFAPQARKFAILGDVAAHAKCGEAFWQEIARTMTEHLKRDQYTDAILFAVEKAGALLAEHFPPGPDDQNELPNEIAGD